MELQVWGRGGNLEREWNFQICTEKSCFPTPTPHGDWMVNLQKIYYAKHWTKYADLHKKFVCHPPTFMGVGMDGSVYTRFYFLPEIECNVKIWSERLHSPNLIPLGLRGVWLILKNIICQEWNGISIYAQKSHVCQPSPLLCMEVGPDSVNLHD